jgi:hypothetical protein
MAFLSLDLHIPQFFDNIVSVLVELHRMSIFCLLDFFDKLAFKFINALLQRVKVAVDCFKVSLKLTEKFFCVFVDGSTDVFLDFPSHLS